MANNLFLKTSINGAENVKNSLRGMRNTMKDVTSNTKKMAQTNKSLGQSFRNLNKDVNRNGVAMGNLSKIYRGFSVAKTIGQIYLIGRVLAGAIESTMDMIETQNLFNVSMGSMAEATGEYLANMSAISGLDLTNLKNSVGTYALLARSMGFTNEQASKLSINTNNLALDLASLTNVPITQVMGDLRSGLLGQSETVYKYGIDVTEAAIKAEAMAQGITKSVRNMSQGEKMALRYAVMIKQTALSHGDFAKTIEEPANQMRILKERVVTMTRALGSIFLPVLASVLPYLNAMAILLTRVFNLIAKFMGYVAPKDENTAGNLGSTVEESMNDASGAVGGATKKLKEMRKYLLGIDELNVIPDNKDTGAGGGGGVGGLDGSILPEMDLTGYDNMLDSIKTKADEIASAIQNAFKDFISGIDFTPLLSSFDTLRNSLTRVVELISGALSWAFENVLKPIGKWTIEKLLPSTIELLASAINFLLDVIEASKPQFEWLWNEFLKPLGEWIGDQVIEAIDSLSESFKKLSDWVKDNEVSVGNIVVTLTLLITAMTLVTKTVALVKGAFAGLKLIWIAIITPFKVFWGAIKTLVSWFGTLWGIIKVVIAWIGKILVTIGAVKLAIIVIIATLVIIIIKYWDEIKAGFISAWENIKETWQEAMDWFAETWENLKQWAKDTWESIKDGAKKAWQGVVDVWNAVTGFFDRVRETITTKLTNAWTSIKTGAKNAWDGIKEVFSKVGTFFSETFSKAWGKVKDIFSTGGKIFDGIKEGIADAFKSIVNRLIRGINKMVAFPFNAINGMLNKVRSTSFLGISPFKSLWSYDPIRVPEIPQLARGGFVDGGGLFQAGEFGKAEMIGNYGGKTTVMPLENTGFVSAMYDAIYSATIDAMSQNGGSDDKEIVLRMNEYTLGKATIKGINRVTRQDGKLGIEGI